MAHKSTLTVALGRLQGPPALSCHGHFCLITFLKKSSSFVQRRRSERCSHRRACWSLVLIHKSFTIFISVKRLLLFQLNSLTKWGFKLFIIIEDSDPITTTEMCCAEAFWWYSHIMERQGAPPLLSTLEASKPHYLSMRKNPTTRSGSLCREKLNQAWSSGETEV